MQIKDYLEKHLILAIGNPFGEYVCTDAIVDDAEKFIEAVLKNERYISDVTWWERAEILSGSKIGYGGPRDPGDPDKYFFAETDICKTFDVNTTKEEYGEYLAEIKSGYSEYNLIPAFTVKVI